jgi:purine-binding chemotaxis protein CheW
MEMNIEQLKSNQVQGDGVDRTHWDEWLQFTLEDQQYGLNVLQIREIICAVEITPVPGADRHVHGIINVRGTIITVVDTRSRLSLPSREMQESDWILIMDINGQSIGLLVDDVSEVVDVDPSTIESMRSNDSVTDSRHVNGVLQTDEGMLVLLNAESLVGLNARQDT